ncbi:MAG: hypothetical protein GF334_02730 [Candidatus Altiarchaeales archaeon]|nr:hypothetical protein [Candidatus Altiarchaeales archaeon]
MTEYHYFKGIARYNRLRQPDDYGNYVIQVEMDEESADKYRNSGIQVAIDDENKVYFRRPDTKTINKELVELGPPMVIDTEGTKLDDLIGQGSEVVVKVRSYDTRKGVGHTLDAIQVRNLVPVESTHGDYNF